MNSKRLLISALVLVLVAGCGGGKFAEEKTLMNTVTKAMETFNSAIGSAAVPEDVAKALGTFTGAIETVLPKMKELTSAHPEWENDPPKELKDTLDKFNAASADFQSTALPKVMKFAQENADNMDLQSAIKKFSGVMSQM